MIGFHGEGKLSKSRKKYPKFQSLCLLANSILQMVFPALLFKEGKESMICKKAGLDIRSCKTNGIGWDK